MFGQIAGIAAALGASLGWTSTDQGEQIRQIAIIGAGPAGASAAYHLNKYAEQAGVTVNITLFEKEDRVGGRTLTVPVYGDGDAVEVGASIFIELNHIMNNATQEFGLTPKTAGSDDAVLGIWDGDEFLFTMDDSNSRWWNIGKLFWKYGMAPYRTQKLMESTIGSFLQIYNSPNFPFKSLTETAVKLGLTNITGVTGEQFLKDQGVGDAYAHDIVQASTRVNYASNIGYIHGLDTMVAMAPEGAMSIDGGNWQIFDQMVNRSGAHVHFNWDVSAIGRRTKGSKLSYSVSQKNQAEEDEEDEDETYGVAFDDIILATPFHFSKIELQDGMLEEPIEEVPYADLKVTLFTSPFRLNPAFFNMPVGSEVPSTILTTLSQQDEPAAFPEGAGKPGFYSVSTLRNTTNPKTQGEEFIYKIFSPDEVTPGFLSRLLGVSVPDSFTGTTVEDPDTEPISWYYPHEFHAYPIAYPRVTFQGPILAPGLYYSSGMETFISTMETNALSGMNIAKLIVDELAAAKPQVLREGEEEEQKVMSDQLQAGSQEL